MSFCSRINLRLPYCMFLKYFVLRVLFLKSVITLDLSKEKRLASIVFFGQVTVCAAQHVISVVV